MLFKIGEYHQMKTDYRKVLSRNEWVKIVGREKFSKDTYVDIEDKEGIIHREVSVKTLRRKAR